MKTVGARPSEHTGCADACQLLGVRNQVNGPHRPTGYV
jgi:hypothetical protein